MAVNDGSVNHHDANSKDPEPEPESTVDETQESTPTNAQQKRKASSPSAPEDATPKSPKRTKVDNEKADKKTEPRPQYTRELGTDRREMARQEEKKRGRRLLGGLMNTLSQASAGSQHKKRQDIERRQQAKSTQQRAEEDRMRMQRLSKLESVRKFEQLKFDEQVFYLPYELTRTQEDTIQDQIQQVENMIEKEVSEFRERKEQRLGSLGVVAKPSISEKDETVGKPHDEPPTDKPQPEPTNRPSSRATNKVGTEKESDRADDVMIEEDEDTVIY
ncbi:hypothetical protein ONZ43_g1571 [Nemania bipapillata]|uniref:Uncharacterized protein n=1 Tax=Nemania bipapillata TaxID=110536 RepID=A0ACC2J3X8_9PEZI|nr:hypothetical protein ONZ43_g1571 [Nemania bipapillata]